MTGYCGAMSEVATEAEKVGVLIDVEVPVVAAQGKPAVATTG